MFRNQDTRNLGGFIIWVL